MRQIDELDRAHADEVANKLVCHTASRRRSTAGTERGFDLSDTWVFPPQRQCSCDAFSHGGRSATVASKRISVVVSRRAGRFVPCEEWPVQQTQCSNKRISQTCANSRRSDDLWKPLTC
jgi:hypothetical protein